MRFVPECIEDKLSEAKSIVRLWGPKEYAFIILAPALTAGAIYFMSGKPLKYFYSVAPSQIESTLTQPGSSVNDEQGVNLKNY